MVSAIHHHFVAFREAREDGDAALGRWTGLDFLQRDHAELHLVLYSQSRNDEADAVFSVLAAHATSPVRLVNPACVQISNLANRTRYADAIRLACSLLEQLGMPVPTENTSEHLGHEVDRFYTLVTTGALERLTSAPELTDELLLGAAKLMNRVGTTAYFCQPLLSRWFQMRLVRLWMEQGYCASMLNPTGYLSCSTISCRNDYATGYRIGRIAMSLRRQRSRTLGCSRWNFSQMSCQLHLTQICPSTPMMAEQMPTRSENRLASL